MIKSLIKRHCVWVCTFLFINVFFFRWFSSDSFINGDVWFILNANLVYLSNFLWKSYFDLGAFYAETPLLAISHISSLPTYFFGFEYNSFTIKLLFFYPFIFFAPWGMFRLSKKLTNSNIAASVAAIFFTINTPNISSLAMGHLHTVTAHIFFPFILLNAIGFFEDVENKSNRSLYMLCFMFALCGIYELRVAYMSFLWLVIFIAFIFARDGLVQLKKIWVLVFSVILTLLISNLYWIMPSIVTFGSEGLASNPILNRPTFGGEYLNILNPLTFFHPYWTSGEIAVFTTQTIPTIFFFIPLFSILGWLVSRKSKYSLYFMLLLIIGILLTKQFNQPFGYIYTLLFDYVPGFKLFREPLKFFSAVGIAHPVLIGFLVAYLEKRKLKKYLLATLAILLAIVFMIATPIFTGRAGTIFTPVDTTDVSYSKLNNYLSKSNDKHGFFRVLWVPTASSLGLIRDKMPHIHLDVLHEYWIKNIKSKNTPSNGAPFDLFFAPELSNILDIYTIRYLVIPKESTAMEGDFYHWYSKRSEYVKRVENTPYLKKIDIGDKSVSLYENVGYYPHIFTSDTIFTLSLKDNSGSVKYENVSPVEYKVKIEKLVGKTYLNFGDAYHQQWRLYAGDFHWTDIFWKKDAVFSDAYHLKNSAQLNSFLIDKDYVMNNLSPSDYKVNGDGSIDLELTIYFRPQAYLYLGSIVSGAYFLSFLLYVLISACRTALKKGNLTTNR